MGELNLHSVPIRVQMRIGRHIAIRQEMSVNPAASLCVRAQIHRGIMVPKHAPCCQRIPKAQNAQCYRLGVFLHGEKRSQKISMIEEPTGSSEIVKGQLL